MSGIKGVVKHRDRIVAAMRKAIEDEALEPEPILGIRGYSGVATLQEQTKAALHSLISELAILNAKLDALEERTVG